MKKKRRPLLPYGPSLADLPATGEELQIIGDPEAMARGAAPVFRKMTLDDLDDDCPICVINRQRILAGDAPTVMVFE